MKENERLSKILREKKSTINVRNNYPDREYAFLRKHEKTR